MSRKYDADPAIQAYVEKKIAVALKAERKRVAASIRSMPLPVNGSKKDAVAMIRNIKQAVAFQ